MTSIEKLKIQNQKKKYICVGLDSDINKIPIHLRNQDDAIFEFNKQIIEQTYRNVAAYKINLAFYEKDGIKGLENLERTLDIIPKDILTIGDAKRGDIGNTSAMYAEALFKQLNFDCSTLSPYMGYDSLSPFLEYEDKLHFILCLTSNPSANDFEKVMLKDGSFLFQKVIEKVKMWNDKTNCGIVFGATQVDELNSNINLFGELPVLVPGVGKQGGSFEEVIKIFKKRNEMNLLINMSRGIIYFDDSEQFAEKANEELIRINNIIKGLLEN